ncbi:MAG TPA: peptidoglycan-associated lipoprotein Pal [Stellaceae bacterium]|nr:peptidoglycan-associated lipoprotein Pal [Stellaceae bacterium]
MFAAMTVLAACSSSDQNTGTTGATSATTPTASSMTPQSELQSVGDRVFFAFDKSDISSEGTAVLQRQADFMKKYPSLTFTVEGHCDERGTREYNLALGERRATSVKKALVALGVPASRVNTISYGKERPAVVGSNEAAYAQNRRGVTVIN